MTAVRRLACITVLLVASIADAIATNVGGSRGCETLPPASDDFAELIVSPVIPTARDDLLEVLSRAGLECVAQLEATGDCLVRYRREGRPEPRLAAPMLKTNIHAFAARPFYARDQRLIGDVFVNEGVEVQTHEPAVSRPHGVIVGTRRVRDPHFHEQAQLRAMNAELAWEGIGAHRPIVAILDNGVWLKHPDLERNLVPGVTIGCRSSDCDGSPVSETDGHGTKVAGVIAAVKDNDEGIVGTAWNAKILPINISAYGATDFSTSCGVEAAIKRGATIINASWWKTSRLKLLRKQLLVANDEVVFVAAAGSDGFRISDKHPSYPLLEDLPNVIGVAASWNTDEPLPPSNYSPWFVHITAEALTFTTQYATAQSPKLYEFALGYTSYSTAYVTGMVALLKSRYPAWGHEWLKWRVISGAVFSRRLAHMSQSQGRLDLAAIMFPVSTAAATVDRSGTTVLDWTKGLRGDMCSHVSIKARTGDADQMGQYGEPIVSTVNDGEESISGDRMPGGTASRIQFLVTCSDRNSDAESPPLALVQ